MSTRDEAKLSAHERAALANLEAAAVADDPHLSAVLGGSHHRWLDSWLPRVKLALTARWRAALLNGGWGGPVLAVGLVLCVLGLSTSLVVGIGGSLLSAIGLRMLASLVETVQLGAEPQDEPDQVAG